MSEGWVVFAYVVVYGFMALYAASLALRARALRRRAEEG
jgi:hypothetical protein